MNGKTHLVWSLAIGVAVAITFQIPPSFALAIIIIVAAIGGLAPDLDHPHSLLGKKIKILNYGAQHRGFLHSIWALILLGLLAYKFLPTLRIETIAFLCGYISHLLLDTITPSGINWFYPFGRLAGPIRSDSIVAIAVLITGVGVFALGFLLYIEMIL